MKKPPFDVENILLDKTATEDILEKPVLDRVFKNVFIFILILGFIAALRLFYLGVFKHNFYANRAFQNVSDFQIERAPRGLIFDRFGKALIKNEPRIDVFLNIYHLPKESEAQLDILKKAALKLGLDFETLKKKIKEYDWGTNPKMLLATNISHDVLVDLSSNSLKGIELEPSFKRVAEPAFKFSHLIGYVGWVDKKDLNSFPELSLNDEIGKSGLEKFYDQFLRGQDGKKVFLKNVKGEILNTEVVSVPKAGSDLYTFIDGPFQEYFYDRLERGLKELNRSSGAGVALNPQNGEVLALVSLPSFDSLKVNDFLEKDNNPLFNRVIQGVYNPGSTIKPLVAAAALKEKIISPSKEIYSAGYLDVFNPYEPTKPTRFLDWRANGFVNVASALARSSNVYFYEVGGGYKDQVGLGIERLKKWWQKFLLHQPTGIDLPNENKGFLPDPSWKEKVLKKPWYLGDTYHVAIGQGDLTVTPIELLNYIAAIANGGKLFQPRIVKEIKTDKQIIEKPVVVLSDLSDELKDVISEVQKGMREAVTSPYGTSHFLADLPIKVSAKTGTAQIQSNTKLNAFFVGYAPSDNPQLAILILIENAKEGSLNTVPIAKDIFNWYAQNRLNANH